MTADEEGVTLHEVNRNVIELRRQISDMPTSFVPMSVWQENLKSQELVRLETGRRIGSIENELAERRKAFTNSFLYPLLMTVLGLGAGALITRLIGG